MLHQGQIWETKDPEVHYRRKIYVCGVQDDEWVWYVHLLSEWNINDTRPAWSKARVNEFERKFTYTNHVVTKRAYWKAKATGNMIQIIGVKDDGWKKVYVYYDLNKIDIHYFLEYFMPATGEETLAAIAKELKVTKNMKKMKRRIEMVKSVPNAPIVYE